MFSTENVKRFVERFVPSDLINKLNGEEEIFCATNQTLILESDAVQLEPEVKYAEGTG